MRKRMLFVDDEPLVLSGLRRALHGMRDEWDMNFVESGAAALEVLGREPYDAVITDMRMPVMDGAELLEEVKRRHPEVVRMVLSGQSSRAALLRAITPAHQYMAKPCDPEELKLRLSQAFAMRDLLSNRTVKAVVSGMKSIPSLPSLYQELTAELHSETSSAAQIGKIISKDIGMAAKILQLANSAFMGLRCHVSSPTQAVSLIGLETVRTLVLSIHVFTQFEGHPEVSAHWPALWDHSTVTASFAQRISKAEGCPKGIAEESFTAGLLHDIGKAVLLAELTDEYQKVLKEKDAGTEALASLELKTLGCTHAQVGAYLMSIWGLPAPLVRAVAYHDAPSAGGERELSSLAVVHIADGIVSAVDPASINQDVRLDNTFLQALNMQDKEATWRSLYEEQAAQAMQAAKGAML